MLRSGTQERHFTLSRPLDLRPVSRLTRAREVVSRRGRILTPVALIVLAVMVAAPRAPSAPTPAATTAVGWTAWALAAGPTAVAPSLSRPPPRP